MAGKTEIVDPWAGALAPKVQPEPTPKTWHHDRDPNRRRATFEVAYPLYEIAIERSADVRDKLPARFEKTKRRFVPGIRFYLAASNLILSEIDFSECKFHRENAQGESKVLGSTFKDCSFERCMLGGTLFRHVKFEASRFIRCDFGGSQFDQCQFIDCTFAECTAENTSFVATEVDPAAVLGGMIAPVYNYAEPLPPGEPSADRIAEEWVEVRRKLAAQLLRSNTDIHHRDNSDRGLYELKRAEVEASFVTLRKRSLEDGVARLLVRATQASLAWLVLNATKGGTSLSRLVLAAMFFVPLYAVLLSISHVTFMNQDCHVTSFHLSFVFQQLARAASLFLAFGYTAFSGGALATIFLTAGASLGLLWYALVAEVVIHRVYR
jgi:hypothetical protein